MADDLLGMSEAELEARLDTAQTYDDRAEIRARLRTIRKKKVEHPPPVAAVRTRATSMNATSTAVPGTLAAMGRGSVSPSSTVTHRSAKIPVASTVTDNTNLKTAKDSTTCTSPQSLDFGKSVSSAQQDLSRASKSTDQSPQVNVTRDSQHPYPTSPIKDVPNGHTKSNVKNGSDTTAKSYFGGVQLKHVTPKPQTLINLNAPKGSSEHHASSVRTTSTSIPQANASLFQDKSKKEIDSVKVQQEFPATKYESDDHTPSTLLQKPHFDQAPSACSDDELYFRWIEQMLPKTKATNHTESMSLFARACRDGSMLCCLCNSVNSNCMDMRAVNTIANMNDTVKIRENMTLFVNSARSLGCNMSVATLDELLACSENTVRSAVAQLFRTSVLAKVQYMYVDERPTKTKCKTCMQIPETKYYELPEDGVLCDACILKPVNLYKIFQAKSIVDKSNATAQTPVLCAKPVPSGLNSKESPKQTRRTAPVGAGTGKSAADALLRWCQNKIFGYEGVSVRDFSESWNDGLAFCAILCTLVGRDKIDYNHLRKHDRRANFELAFDIAEAYGVPRMLDVDDMVRMSQPDKYSVMLYISELYKRFN